MITFVNKHNNKIISVLEQYVTEGSDYFYIKRHNMSLPKADWETLF